MELAAALPEVGGQVLKFQRLPRSLMHHVRGH